MIVILIIRCHMQLYMVSGSSLSVKATQKAITYSQIVILLYFTTVVFLIHVNMTGVELLDRTLHTQD